MQRGISFLTFCCGITRQRKHGSHVQAVATQIAQQAGGSIRTAARTGRSSPPVGARMGPFSISQQTSAGLRRRRPSGAGVETNTSTKMRPQNSCAGFTNSYTDVEGSQHAKFVLDSRRD